MTRHSAGVFGDVQHEVLRMELDPVLLKKVELFLDASLVHELVFTKSLLDPEGHGRNGPIRSKPIPHDLRGIDAGALGVAFAAKYDEVGRVVCLMEAVGHNVAPLQRFLRPAAPTPLMGL